MNAIESIINLLKNEIKRLEQDYKLLLKDGSYRNVYPSSVDGIDQTLEIIAHRAFELKVCNSCPNFLNCDHGLLCIESIDGSADMAKEYGDRCYNALLDKFRE